MSLIIVLCELTSYWEWDDNYLHNMLVAHSGKGSGSSFFLTNLICFLPLGYICYASNYGMFALKVQSLYALHDNNQTDPSSLVYSAMLLTRLGVAVAYNFLALTGIKSSAFFIVMGPLTNISFLGEGFNQWIFPSCLFFMILLTLTNCYGRLLNYFGIH